MSLSEPLDDPWADSAATERRPPASSGAPSPRSDRDGSGDRRDRTGDRDDHRSGSRDRRTEQHERGRDTGGWDSDGPAFERVPPQDTEAEQSVLGGMLLSKDAIADVIEVLKGHDFYRPAHETIYQAILDLYAKGEPADPITVAAELTRRGEITRVGGASYLHSLVQTVPTAANAEYYAEIVHERAVLRRLVEAGTRITQMGYAADGDVDEIVNSAQAEIYAVTEQRTSEDYLPLGEIMEGALDEIEAIGSRSGEMTGVPTGFTDFDSLTNGLHPGQMIVVAARPAMGKALALDTPLPTPSGWTTMGDVAPGDLLLGADGRPTRVVAATEVMHGRPCYEITFDDGTVAVADADHQWVTQARDDADAPVPDGSAPDAPAPDMTAPDMTPDASGAARAGGTAAGVRTTALRVRTTKEIAASLTCEFTDGGPNHSVPLTAPLDLPEQDLPEPPYALGRRLGATSAGAVDAETGARSAATPTGDGIPRPYLRAAPAQRRALLAGLIDTAGAVTPTGAVHLALASPALTDDVRDLLTGLGHRCTVTTRRVPVRGTRTSTVHTVAFTCDDEVFGADGRGRADGARRRATEGCAPGGRFVTAVREVESVPVRCVQVDNADHLYLATRSMVPTHNSTLALDFARHAAVKNELPSVIFSLEMGRNEIAMRLLSAEARVALHHMRSGTMTDDDWTRLARRMPEVTAAPLYIDDSPNLSMMEIRAKCRRLKQRHDLKLVVIDYLQLMQSGGSRRPESRQQEVSDMSRNLKLLAKELELPVVALSQLNRGPEQRTDKKPMVSDLRESGSIEQDADMVILLHREDAYEKESPRAGEADLIVAKHRNGPTATITVAFQGHYSRFVDMAGA